MRGRVLTTTTTFLQHQPQYTHYNTTNIQPPPHPQGIVPGLLRVASAALDPPRPHSAPITPTEHETFNTQVQGASHTALCAIARLAAHAAPSCTSELLSGGVMPLLAALVGARDAPMILRRAALVALVDLCQVVGVYYSCTALLYIIPVYSPVWHSSRLP